MQKKNVNKRFIESLGSCTFATPHPRPRDRKFYATPPVSAPCPHLSVTHLLLPVPPTPYITRSHRTSLALHCAAAAAATATRNQPPHTHSHRNARRKKQRSGGREKESDAAFSSLSSNHSGIGERIKYHSSRRVKTPISLLLLLLLLSPPRRLRRRRRRNPRSY